MLLRLREDWEELELLKWKWEWVGGVIFPFSLIYFDDAVKRG